MTIQIGSSKIPLRQKCFSSTYKAKQSSCYFQILIVECIVGTTVSFGKRMLVKGLFQNAKYRSWQVW